MGLMPHIDSLWFGEGYEYAEESEDYWLVEVSGIAFGLTGELMCTRGGASGAAPWRGLLYGATPRACTYEPTDQFQRLLAKPSSIWNLSDTLGLDRAQMVGYWDEERPVVLTDCPDVRATAYVRRGKFTLVALASWRSPLPRDENVEPAAAGANSTNASNHLPASKWSPHGCYRRCGFVDHKTRCPTHAPCGGKGDSSFERTRQKVHSCRQMCRISSAARNATTCEEACHDAAARLNIGMIPKEVALEASLICRKQCAIRFGAPETPKDPASESGPPLDAKVSAFKALLPSGLQDVLAGKRLDLTNPAVTDKCSLKVDWAALGLDPTKATSFSPTVRNWQGVIPIAIGAPPEYRVGPVPVTAWRGRLLLIGDRTEMTKLPRHLYLDRKSRLPPKADCRIFRLPPIQNAAYLDCRNQQARFDIEAENRPKDRYDIDAMTRWGSHVP